jgi:hypothetical protein
MRNHFLFLDFDGVLHSDFDEHEHPFSQVNNFSNALRRADPKQKIDIVISSMWRLSENLDQLRAHFPIDIQERIIGVTPDLNDFERSPNGSRQREIEHWMQEHAPHGHWLAIDDRANYFDPACENLYLVPQFQPDIELDLQVPFSLMQTIEHQEAAVSMWQTEVEDLRVEMWEKLEMRLWTFVAF